MDLITTDVHSGNDPIGATTLTVTPLYVACHVITSVFKVLSSYLGAIETFCNSNSLLNFHFKISST
ncbi:hypothetical protein IKN40_03340 [bacterium]|nr:hypothetical protein [bacterium]